VYADEYRPRSGKKSSRVEIGRDFAASASFGSAPNLDDLGAPVDREDFSLASAPSSLVKVEAAAVLKQNTDWHICKS